MTVGSDIFLGVLCNIYDNVTVYHTYAFPDVKYALSDIALTQLTVSDYTLPHRVILCSRQTSASQ